MGDTTDRDIIRNPIDTIILQLLTRVNKYHTLKARKFAGSPINALESHGVIGVKPHMRFCMV
jgi:hypothetical protein